MQTVKFTLLLGYIIIVFLVVAFNMLYSARTIRANKHIGLYTPQYIRQLVKISNGLAIATAMLAVVSLVLNLY